MNFSGANAVLATRHGKGQVIVPVLAAELGLRVEVLDALDTDQFGTFTRETPRAAGFRDTARLKARAALAAHPQADWGLASEGSFGPHPTIPFVPGGIEIVLLLNRAGNLELSGTDLTLETNYAARAVSSLDEAREFAAAAKFPAHGLIVMPCRDGQPVAESIVKGITTADALAATVGDTLRQYGAAWVETDMRAHYNPTRMQAIERATRALAANARSLCPQCGRPGFVVTDVIRGLPCAECRLPTQRPRAEVLVCAGCACRVERDIPDAVAASPGECQWCNP